MPSCAWGRSPFPPGSPMACMCSTRSAPEWPQARATSRIVIQGRSRALAFGIAVVGGLRRILPEAFEGSVFSLEQGPGVVRLLSLEREAL